MAGGWMGPIVIHLSKIEVQINAGRRQIFQFISAFGDQTTAGEPSSRILSRQDDSLIVEFITPVPLPFRINKTVRTVERVTLYEPERIEFEEMEGPFAIRREYITLDEQEGTTRLQYNALLGIKGWVPGWLLGVLFVRPMLRRVVGKHFDEMREKLEKSAVS